MSRKTRNLIWSAPSGGDSRHCGRAGRVHDVDAQRGDGAVRGRSSRGCLPTLPAKGLGADQHRADVGRSSRRRGRAEPQTAYRIDYSDGRHGLVLRWILNYDSSVYTDDTDLPRRCNEKRYYRVFAFNSGGSGPALGYEVWGPP